MEPTMKTKPWVILLWAFAITGTLVVVNNNFGSLTQAIQTPAVTDSQLKTVVSTYEGDQQQQLDALREEVFSINARLTEMSKSDPMRQVELATLKQQLQEQALIITGLQNKIAEQTKKQAAIDPQTHPMVAATLGKKQATNSAPLSDARSRVSQNKAGMRGESFHQNDPTGNKAKTTDSLKTVRLLQTLANNKKPEAKKPTLDLSKLKQLQKKSSQDSVLLKKVFENQKNK